MGDILPRIFLILDGAWRRRYLIGLPIVLMPILGAIISYASPKQYTSHTSMLVQETAKLNPFLEDLAVSANLEARMEALKTLLHSRHILSEVALEEGLMQPKDSAVRKDGVIAQLSAALNVVKVGTDLIRIDYRASQPVGMSSLLETVSTHFVDQLLAPERSSIRESEKFLKRHLVLSRTALDEAEDALAAYRSDHADGLPELHSANTERLARIRQRLVERESKLAGSREGLGSMDEQLSRTDPVLQRLEDQIVQHSSELASLMSRYTEGHSLVQAERRLLRRLEQERSLLLKRNREQRETEPSKPILNQAVAMGDGGDVMLMVQLEAMQSARHNVASLTEEVAQLKVMAASLESQISGVGEQEQQLRVLERDLRVKRSLYEDLLMRYEMAQVTGALGIFEQSERIKVIDRPYTPSRPSNPPVWFFIVAGLVGGLLIGCGLALFAELADPMVRTAAQAEQICGVPVLSRIPPLKEC